MMGRNMYLQVSWKGDVNEAKTEDRQQHKREMMMKEYPPGGSNAEVKGWPWRGGSEKEGVRRATQLTAKWRERNSCISEDSSQTRLKCQWIWRDRARLFWEGPRAYVPWAAEQTAWGRELARGHGHIKNGQSVSQSRSVASSSLRPHGLYKGMDYTPWNLQPEYWSQ